MKSRRLPILLCHANCPKCGLPTEFKMFESGLGGDFLTFIGTRAESIYRVDLGKVHYQKMTLDELLLPALQQEESLRQVPKEIHCKLCGNVFSAVSIAIDGEEIIDAYEL